MTPRRRRWRRQRRERAAPGLTYGQTRCPRCRPCVRTQVKTDALSGFATDGEHVECPALDTEDLTDDRDILLAVATNAIEALESYGVDTLSVELILAMLVDAHDLDIS